MHYQNTTAMNLRRFLYVMSNKRNIAICLLNTNTQSSTLGHVFNRSLIGSVHLRVSLCSYSRSHSIVLCSLVPSNPVFSYNVDTLHCLKKLQLTATGNHIYVINGAAVVS